MALLTGQFIETIRAQDLRTYEWPILRLLFPTFVEEIELGRYVKALLLKGRWSIVRLEPHLDGTGHVEADVFDIYATPTMGLTDEAQSALLVHYPETGA